MREEELCARPDRHFADPLDVLDRDGIEYEVRLRILQSWLSRIASGEAERGSRSEVEGAIVALQTRSKLKLDTPGGQPRTTTYGGVERSNLRVHALQRVFHRMRRMFRP